MCELRYIFIIKNIINYKIKPCQNKITEYDHMNIFDMLIT
jgi:hypothetical protein